MEKLHYPWTDTKPGVYSSDEEWISWRAYCRYMQRSIVFGVSAELPRLEKVGREPVVQVGVFAYHTTDSPVGKVPLLKQPTNDIRVYVRSTLA